MLVTPSTVDEHHIMLPLQSWYLGNYNTCLMLLDLRPGY